MTRIGCGSISPASRSSGARSRGGRGRRVRSPVGEIESEDSRREGSLGAGVPGGAGGYPELAHRLDGFAKEVVPGRIGLRWLITPALHDELRVRRREIRAL